MTQYAIGRGGVRYAIGTQSPRYAIGQGASGRANLIGNRSMLVGAGAGAPRNLPRGATVYEVDESYASAARRLPLGFATASAVAAGATVTVTGSPQTLFRPERLIVPSSIAPFFEISDIVIGNVTQSAAAGRVSATTYSEVAVGVGLLFDTAQPGVDIQILVTNTGAEALTFRCVMIGAAVVGAP